MKLFDVFRQNEPFPKLEEVGDTVTHGERLLYGDKMLCMTIELKLEELHADEQKLTCRAI